MYRYDPSVMLYAPLRTVIRTAAEGPAWCAVDQPSTVFAVSREIRDDGRGTG
jgi:hypothetical protein